MTDWNQDKQRIIIWSDVHPWNHRMSLSLKELTGPSKSFAINDHNSSNIWRSKNIKDYLPMYLNISGCNQGITASILLVNSLRLSDAYMHQEARPPLVQIMACCLFSTKPLSKPMLDYCQWDNWEHISMKFESKCDDFHTRKGVWKCCLEDGGHFVSASMC